jgi:hypothetical protein
MNNTADIRWLIVGALAGLVAAAYGVLRQSPSVTDLPASAIASVNDVIIERDTYDRALSRVAAQDMTAEDRMRLIERLIEDELMVQRGVELGMTESDTEVRNAIVNSLIASVTAEADASSPTDEELQQYLVDNAYRVSFTSKLSVDAWQTDVEPLAQQLVTEIRAGAEPSLGEEIEAMPDLPSGFIPVEVLRDYLGPAITAAAAEMPEGSSAVFARRGRWLVIRVIGTQREQMTDLDAIRNRVLLDYRRRLADDMLQTYVDGLRQRAKISVATP